MDAWSADKNMKAAKTVPATSFPFVMKALLLIGRITALAPVVTDVDSYGNCTVRSIRSNDVYCVVLMLAVHAFSVPAAIFLYIQYKSPSLVLNFSLFGRALASCFIHITCLRKRLFIMEGFRRTLRLKKRLRRRFLFIPLATILAFSGTSLAFYESMFKSPRMIILAMPLALLPPLVTIIVCALFTCQVETLRQAILNLRDDIIILSGKQNSFRGQALHAVIKQYHALYTISAILNEAYGLQTLLATFHVFLDSIVCAKHFTQFPKEQHGVSCLIWSIIVVVPIMWAMSVCQNAENSVRETQSISTNIRNFLTDDIPFHTRIKIRWWEIQLQQQPIKFCAGGFFYFNGMHMKTVTSTLINYVIILMQNVNFKVRIVKKHEL